MVYHYHFISLDLEAPQDLSFVVLNPSGGAAHFDHGTSSPYSAHMFTYTILDTWLIALHVCHNCLHLTLLLYAGLSQGPLWIWSALFDPLVWFVDMNHFLYLSMVHAMRGIVLPWQILLPSCLLINILLLEPFTKHVVSCGPLPDVLLDLCCFILDSGSDAHESKVSGGWTCGEALYALLGPSSSWYQQLLSLPLARLLYQRVLWWPAVCMCWWLSLMLFFL